MENFKNIEAEVEKICNDRRQNSYDLDFTSSGIWDKMNVEKM